MCITGDSTTIIFVTGGTPIVGRIVSLDEWEERVDAIKDNDLGMAIGDHEKHCIGGLIRHDEIEGVMVFDPDDIKAIGNFANQRAASSIRITYQVPPGGTTGHTTTFDGWVVRRSRGNLENGVRSEGPFSVLLEGGNAPFTEVAST